MKFLFAALAAIALNSHHSGNMFIMSTYSTRRVDIVTGMFLTIYKTNKKP